MSGILGSGSVHRQQKYAKRPAKLATAANIVCQKCLQAGHWTYECKNAPVYQARPSRTKQLKDPKRKQKFMEPSQMLPEMRDSSKAAKPATKKRKKSDSDSSSSSSSSDSDTDSSDSSSSSSSGSSSSDDSSSDSSGSSSSDSSSDSDSSSSSDSETSSDSDSSSSDSDSDGPPAKKRKGAKAAADVRGMPVSRRAPDHQKSQAEAKGRERSPVRHERRAEASPRRRDIEVRPRERGRQEGREQQRSHGRDNGERNGRQHERRVEEKRHRRESPPRKAARAVSDSPPSHGGGANDRWQME